MDVSLGTVLVTGGCGYVGFHLVKALLDEPSCSSVHVFSRNPTVNLVERARYHAGSITSIEDVRNILDKVQPRVIFHAAAPVGSGNNVNYELFYEIIVQGTKHVLDCAQNAPSVKAFVYTSSAPVVQEPFSFVTEDRPLLAPTSRKNHYFTTKAIADNSVLKANNPTEGFRTACLRLTVIYGERDSQMIPQTLQILRDGRQRFQIGTNTSLYDGVSVENAVSAHLLAAKALLRGIKDPKAPKVDGEAFFITDDNPQLFWDFARKIWRAAGDETPPESIIVIPAWVMIGLAIVAEWFYWIFTFGQRTPKILRVYAMRWVTTERTFSVEKAKKRLGYKPVDNMDEIIRRGVKWSLEHDDQVVSRARNG